MTASELLLTVSGLSGLGAEPNTYWMKAVLSDTQMRMKDGSFTLSQLGRLAAALAGETHSPVSPRGGGRGHSP